MPELIILAGPNGSGKSTLASQLSFSCEYICADMYEKLLTHIDDRPTKDLKKMLMVAKKIDNALAANESFVFETVFSVKTMPSFLKTAKEKGYIINLHYIAPKNSEISVGRVAKRVSEGGHNVPRHHVISNYNKSVNNLSLLMDFVDNAIVYDSSDGAIRPFWIKEENQTEIIGSIPKWASDAVKKSRTNLLQRRRKQLILNPIRKKKSEHEL